MHKEFTKQDYHNRISRVIDYIHDNLYQSDMSLDDLAQIACLSPYHFHRIYVGVTGETIAKTIRRLKLHRAAYSLVKTDISVDRISAKAGYANIESFIRKFNEDFKLTPSAYRKRGKFIILQVNESNLKENLNMYEVEIVELEDIRLAVMDNSGSYMNISRVFEKFFATVVTHNMMRENKRCFGLYYDNPKTVPEDKLRSKAGMTLEYDQNPIGEMKEHIIEGGKYAVILYKGPYADMTSAYDWFFGPWLTESGYEIADKPALEEYINSPKMVEPSELLTKIYMPLK